MLEKYDVSEYCEEWVNEICLVCSHRAGSHVLTLFPVALAGCIELITLRPGYMDPDSIVLCECVWYRDYGMETN